MNLELRDQNNLPTTYSSIVTIAFVRGEKRELKQTDVTIVVTTYRKHFHPRIGWELKDVVTIGLPQSLRFYVLQGIEKRELQNMGYFILFYS